MHYMKKSLLFLIVTILISTLLYGLSIWLFRNQSNFDTQSYQIIGKLTLHGKNIYPDPAISRHPYFPFFLYFEAGSIMLAKILGTSPIVIIKSFLTLFHLISVLLIFHLTKQSRLKTFLYAINPISLLVTTFHGQFDIVPLTFLLAGLLAIEKKRYAMTIVLLSLAVTIKSWPLLFVIPFLKRIPKKYWYILLLLPTFSLLLYSYLFHTSLF